MKVHLIKKATIEKYTLDNAGSKIPLQEWLSKLKKADWNNPGDIRNTYHSADLLGAGSMRVVFDIGGNNYRVICRYLFGETEVHLFVCWMGTHAEYDRLCRNRMQYSINEY